LLNQDDDINALQVCNIISPLCFCLIDTLTQLFNCICVVKLLKVRNLSGEWISAPPVPGTFVCNIGDMLKVYYN
jgi:hypothetical protein